MENLLEEVKMQRTDDFYTPESLAWDLLVGNTDNTKVEKLLDYSYERVDNKKKIASQEKLTFRFEILLTIFMEILFDLAKLNCYGENNEGSLKFEPKYEKFNINAYIDLIEDKFKILGFCVFINKEKMENFSGDKDGFKFLMENRYCRVLLKNYSEDNSDFENLPGDTYYHMKINGLNKNKYDDLKQIYSIFFWGEYVYCVNFCEI